MPLGVRHRLLYLSFLDVDVLGKYVAEGQPTDRVWGPQIACAFNLTFQEVSNNSRCNGPNRGLRMRIPRAKHGSHTS